MTALGITNKTKKGKSPKLCRQCIKFRLQTSKTQKKIKKKKQK